MASKPTDEDSVLILLSTKSPTTITHPERRIRLTQSHPTLKIGRSSNRTALALLPLLDNAYFDSPVMSREHAEIEADIPRQVVKIRDAGSMHGTYINDEPLDSEVVRTLASGDEVTFGSSVYRNQKTFQPATVTVSIEFKAASQAHHSPSRVFTVPDDCSTDENEPFDDNTIRKIPIFMSDEGKDMNTCEEINQERDMVRQMDGIIEIDSSSESDSDELRRHDCTSVMSGDVVDMHARDMVPEFDDDESISLTDDPDDDTSSAPASSAESIDLDDPISAGARSPSWNSVSTDPQSDHLGRQPPSGHNSEDEQGVFLYDTESQEMDNIDSVDVDSDRDPQPVIHQSQYLQAQTTLPAQTVPSEHPTLPSINTALRAQEQFAQEHFADFDFQLAPVIHLAPRRPSPSDAVLLVGRGQHGSEDDCPVTVDSLGRKSGKPEFFEAREQNKIKISHSASLAPSPTHRANILKETLPPPTGNIAPFPSSPLKGVTLESAHVLDRVCLEALQHQEVHTAPVSLPLASQGTERKLREPIPMPPKEALSTAPVEERLDTSVKPREALDPAWTAASADELFRMKQSAEIRTPSHVLGLTEEPIGTELSEPRKDTAKGKRKAADISETADHREDIWHKQFAAGQQLAASSSVPAQPDIDMDLSRLSFQNAPEERPIAVRPTKMRKIAERVGYAALGGATVGAVVLTSLIYTAPNFT